MNCSIISLTPPYSFDRLLRRLETHPDTQIRVNKEKNSLQRVYRIGLRPVLVSMQFIGSLEEPALRYETQVILPKTDQQLLEKMIRRTFSADLDLSVIYEQMREEKELAILTERFRGLRLMLDADLFQCMVKTIIGQQINLIFAANLSERLVTRAGDPVENSNGEGIIAFPTPDAVARLTVEDLRSLQFSQRKAEYIIDFARAIVNETVDLERLWTMEDEEIITYLTSLRGIGRWTVECLLMFGMGRPDLLPAADIGLRNGIVHLYGMKTKPNENDIRKLGEKWAPWRSIYCLYVWEAVGAIKRKEVFDL
ncbi:DNA-3-methyladenine glycosylase [Brevibacillus sp. M2.1A]|uniref:DNA-3-methyladenine glycosylase family protein n=1 Tax=Brevibacillus TaxID=55080 RepID=UPI00156BA9EE|nr:MULTISPECIES: DNA-3-methyladenine glycosylase [Brevibacillus]MBY0087969.1 DNA-3-methyladenine glycosylase 2 family protein [Brevibacillus brevis]MCC8434410.1 DNA-3-methyladenine glycosylase [Brevibacillus sp. M2.1A]